MSTDKPASTDLRGVESRVAALHQQGDSLGAIAYLTDAINHNRNRGSLWALRAIIRHSLAQWRRALSDIETAMTLTPLPVGGQLVLGDCYAHLGHLDLALTAYQHLLTQGPLPTDFYAGLYAGFCRCGRNDLALESCREAVEVEPENYAAYFGMAHCMASLGYSAAYIAGVLRTAVRLSPTSTAYRTSLAIQLVRDGKPAEALAELQSVPSGDLTTVGCACSARTLLQLSIWADDRERTVALGQAVRRLTEERR